MMLALLAPHHPAVVECPHAPRTSRSPRTCYRWLTRLTAWFNYLTDIGVHTLADVTQEMCEHHLEAQSWSAASRPGVSRPAVPAAGSGTARRLDPQSTVDLVRVVQAVAVYPELLSTDRYRPGFLPWDGRAANVVTGARSHGENATQPVPDTLLQPLLATCLFLVQTVGPHLAQVIEDLRADKAARSRLPLARYHHLPELHALCQDLLRRAEPLPTTPASSRGRWEHHRHNALNALCWTHLVAWAGFGDITDHAKDLLRPAVRDLAAVVGFAGRWARDATPITPYPGGDPIPWTDPLDSQQAQVMTQHVLTACLTLTAALTGMRTSELLELETGCRRPAADGSTRRHRVTGKLIKNKTFGGVPDEWVVIDEVDQAIALAERLAGAPAGTALFSYVTLTPRLALLRDWLARTGLGAHWGLPEIPDGPCTLRMLRRILSA